MNIDIRVGETYRQWALAMDDAETAERSALLSRLREDPAEFAEVHRLAAWRRPRT